MILYDFNETKYTMTFYENDSNKLNIASNVKVGDNIVISGYGICIDALNINLVINDIKYK